MTHRLALLAALAMLAAGCQTSLASSSGAGAAAPASGNAAPAARQALARPAKPPAFVEAACGGCHAVEPPFLSPNPESPSFEAIANRAGLTEATLGAWLFDAHNYPEQMDFTLTREQAQAIADYMVTLRRKDYVPER